ncbi:MAG: hypothetical protein RJA61_679 [Candidatus Parcubacteria bacterium]|jgi:hypothetical protein
MKQVEKKITPKKHQNQPGKWVERPRRMEILVCACGNKYIKTRDRQKTCIRCINDVVLEAK